MLCNILEIIFIDKETKSYERTNSELSTCVYQKPVIARQANGQNPRGGIIPMISISYITTFVSIKLL